MQAITANDLITGEAVFRRGGAWAERLEQADLYADADAAAEALAGAAEPTRVVDPYLIDLRLQDAVAIPVSYRERIRALGPSTQLDVGKQADGGETVRVMQEARSFGRSAGRLGLIRKK